MLFALAFLFPLNRSYASTSSSCKASSSGVYVGPSNCIDINPSDPLPQIQLTSSGAGGGLEISGKATKVISKSGLTIIAQGGQNPNGSGGSVKPAVISIDKGASLELNGGIRLMGMADAGMGYGNGIAKLEIDNAQLQINGGQAIKIGSDSETNDIVDISNNSHLVIAGGMTTVSGGGTFSFKDSEIDLKGDGSGISFTNGKRQSFQDTKIVADGNSFSAGTIRLGNELSQPDKAFRFTNDHGHLTLWNSIIGGDVSVSGTVYLDPLSEISQGGVLNLNEGSLLNIQTGWINSTAAIKGSGTVDLSAGTGATLEITNNASSSNNFSGTVNAKGGKLNFDTRKNPDSNSKTAAGYQTLNGATLNQADIHIANGASIKATSGVLTLNGDGSSGGGSINIDDRTSDSDPYDFTITGKDTTLSVGNLEVLQSGVMALEDHSTLTFAPTTVLSDRGEARIGLELTPKGSIHFDQSHITLNNPVPGGYADLTITGDISGLTGDPHENPKTVGPCGTQSCIGNTYDHLTFYDTEVAGDSLHMLKGYLFFAPDARLDGVDTFTVDAGASVQLQSWETDQKSRDIRVKQSAGHLTGAGVISLGDSTELDITGTHNEPLIDANNPDLASSTTFSGTIMSIAGGLYHQILNFNDVTVLEKGAKIEAINEVGFYKSTSITDSELLGDQTIRFQSAGTTKFENSTIGIYDGKDLQKPIKPIDSGIVWAGYRDLSDKSDKTAYDQPSSGILSVAGKSSIQTDEFFIGRTGTADTKASEIANLTGSGVTADLGQLVVGQASNAQGTTNTGTLNITSGAKVSVDDTIKYADTKTPGIYVGNNSGSGPDKRSNSAAGDADGTIEVSGSGSSLLLKNGVMYVGSNSKTGSGQVAIKDSGSLSFNKSTLNVGNNGSVYISNSGVLNANGSSISLGNLPVAQSFDDKKPDSTPPKFDDGATLGDVNIEHGVLNITGDAGAAHFSGKHTGNLEVQKGSIINVGTKDAAGSLNVDGNMIIADDTVSNFYEGDAKPCPAGSGKYSCSHGPSKETNPAADSAIHVSGDLHLGGTINVYGTEGQPDDFDDGLYELYTYGGKWDGSLGNLKISSDYIATFYTDDKGEIDVLIWNKNDAPPSVVNGGGDKNWNDIPTGGGVIIDGNNNGKPKDTDITIDPGATAVAPNIIIHSGGTTIHGGSISGSPTKPKAGSTSTDPNAPVHINVNGDPNDKASGKISSDINDPTKKDADGKNVPAGHTSIKKDGGGDLVIDGGKKGYSGSTDVAGGTLDIGGKDVTPDPKNPNDPNSADISNSSGTTVDNGGTINVHKGSKTSKITVNGGGTANISGQTGNIDNKGGTTNINGDDTKNANPDNPNDKDTDNTINNTDGGTVNINDGGTAGKIDSKDSDTNVKKGGTSGDIHSDGGSVNVDGNTGKIDVDNGGSANINGGGSSGDITVNGNGSSVNVDGNSGTADAEGGATISGSGTIKGGATVGPGSTIHAGSTTDPKKASSGIDVDGDLNMGGNSTIDGSSGGEVVVHGKIDTDKGPVHVHVDGNGGCTEAGSGNCKTHTVAHADDGITNPGNLGPDDVNSGPLIKRKVVIGGDGKDVDVQSNIPTYVVPGTNSGTGSGLDGLSHSDSAAAHSILDPLTNINTVAGLKKAYTALSGEINADARTAMIDDGYMLQEAVIQRLDCMNDDLRRKAIGKKGIKNNYCTVDPKHHFTVWGRMFGARGDSFGSGQATMTQSSAGWIVGSDAQIAGTWRVGGILSYGRDWFGAHDIQSTGHSDDVSLGMYAGNSWNMNNGLFDASLVLKMGAIYTWDIMHTHRTVEFQGYNGSLSANTLGSTFQGFSELGYKMLFNKHHKTPIEVEPFARLSFINFDTDNYAEHGATAALNVHGEGTTVGYVDLGVKVASSIPINDGSYFSPHAALSYRGAFGDTNPRIHEEFAAAHSGNYDMTINGVPISANTADLNIGFTVHVDDKIDFDMDYIGQYGSHITSSGGMGTFRYRF